MRFTCKSMSGCLGLIAMVASAAISGCGSSDEQQIRDTVSALERSLDKQDAGRACELLTARAEAQYATIAGLFVPRDGCADAVRNVERSDDQKLSQRSIDTAKVSIRDDLAILGVGRKDRRVGLRRVDGDWQVDNVLNPNLRDEQRGEASLARGSDEQQIRATMLAASMAVVQRQYARVCNLMSYGAEAQVFIGAAFASVADPAAAKDGSQFSCADALRVLRTLADDALPAGLATARLSREDVDAASVSIHGPRATVRIPGGSAGAMVRIDGRWLVDSDAAKPRTAGDLGRCWRAAGAKIATRARELRFAVGDRVSDITLATGRVSVKSTRWRIFYTLPKNGEDPGLQEVLSDPGIVATVAYVRDAPAHPDVVRAARVCGDEV